MKTQSPKEEAQAEVRTHPPEKGPRVTRRRVFCTLHSALCTRSRGFTLLELLVVISIIGLIAALTMPVMNNFKPNYTANATRTLLDELARARQLAISQRTTVYMVFVPTNFVADDAYGVLPTTERAKAAKLLDKQLIGYAFVSLRSMGDQPGRPTVRYLSEWKTLPEGAFIAMNKFARNNQWVTIYTNGLPAFQVYGFTTTPWVPFPSADAAPYKLNPLRQPYVTLPYIAFDYMGRLVSFDAFNKPVPGRNEIIPLAKGSIMFARDQTTKQPIPGLPRCTEQPPGNSTNAYNLVAIDWLTGRARGVQQEVR
ncbi:MAG TPA: type II secretion system protein [Verrucomicrobiae bacterium]